MEGDDRKTLFYLDPSRSGQVVHGLMGEMFGGTLVCAFFGGSAFAAAAFCRRGRRLVKDLLKLKPPSLNPNAMAISQA